MRKRNHTVTIRMNEKEYALLRQKMKEAGQTQQALVLAAIENVEIALLLFFRLKEHSIFRLY